MINLLIEDLDQLRNAFKKVLDCRYMQIVGKSRREVKNDKYKSIRDPSLGGQRWSLKWLIGKVDEKFEMTIVDVKNPDGTTTFSSRHQDILQASCDHEKELARARVPVEPRTMDPGMRRAIYSGDNRSALPPGTFDEILFRTTADERAALSASASKDTAPGPTGITLAMLLWAGPELETAVWDLIDHCLETQVFPKSLGHSYVKHLLKKPGFQTLANTRPIALIDALAKLLTSVITHRLNIIDIKFRHSPTPLFRANQNAFRAFSGCYEALFKVLACMEDAKQFGKEIHILYTDIKAAYPSVNFWSLEKHYRRKGLGRTLSNLCVRLMRRSLPK
jgi:hypothetical protein